MDQRCFGRPVTSAPTPMSSRRWRTWTRTALEILLPLRRPCRHHLLDLGVALGVQGGEGQVLELPAHLLHAEAVGQRRVDVEGLLGRAALLPLGHHGQGAHVVQPVGQLDQEDPPVVRHGDEHLADGGGLLGLLGVELQPVQLGDAVDHAGHAVAEGLGDGLEGEAGVLHGVVQEGGGHRLGVEAELGHDRGHGHRVGDVGLAGAPELPLVGLHGRPAGVDDHRRLVLGAVRGELGQQGCEQSRGSADSSGLLEVAHPGQGHHPSSATCLGKHWERQAAALWRQACGVRPEVSACASCPCAGAAGAPGTMPGSPWACP